MNPGTGVVDLMDQIEARLPIFVSMHNIDALWSVIERLQILHGDTETDAMSRCAFVLSTLVTLLDNEENCNHIPAWPRALLYHLKTPVLHALFPEADLQMEIETVDETLKLLKQVKKAVEEDDQTKLEEQGAIGQRKPAIERLDETIGEGERLLAFFQAALEAGEEGRNAPIWGGWARQ